MIEKQHLGSFPVPIGLTAPRPALGDPLGGIPEVYRSERLLEPAGGQHPTGTEAKQVTALLLQKLARDTPDDDESAADIFAVRSAFLRHRFMAPLASYQLGDRFYSYLDTALNLVSIGAGIGASLLAASGSPKGWTIILGVTIAACQTFSQWLKPSKRAACRSRAACELRNEAWDILQGRERYRDKDVNRAWDLFCDRIDRIADRQRTQEGDESRAGSTATFSGTIRGGR